MKLIKPPNKIEFGGMLNVFLAGSIEMGTAENWQDKFVNLFSSELDINFFNPRREDWDSSWVQSIDNPQFNEQVNWELEAIDSADMVVFYFDPNTKSPITLMELGFVIGRQEAEIVVCCPEGFWRKGNVDIICKRNEIKQFNDIYELSEAVGERYFDYHYMYKSMIESLQK